MVQRSTPWANGGWATSFIAMTATCRWRPWPTGVRRIKSRTCLAGLRRSDQRRSAHILYAGPFELLLDRDTVIHYIEVCSYPNWIGPAASRQARTRPAGAQHQADDLSGSDTLSRAYLGARPPRLSPGGFCPLASSPLHLAWHSSTRFHHYLGESKFTECLKVQGLSGVTLRCGVAWWYPIPGRRLGGSEQVPAEPPATG
jgi:hypothetical protein